LLCRGSGSSQTPKNLKNFAADEREFARIKKFCFYPCSSVYIRGEYDFWFGQRFCLYPRNRFPLLPALPSRPIRPYPDDIDALKRRSPDAACYMDRGAFAVSRKYRQHVASPELDLQFIVA
jgi:hypothetical protein